MNPLAVMVVFAVLVATVVMVGAAVRDLVGHVREVRRGR